MTFSILARDPTSGEMGCAAATGNLAVGAWVLRASPGAGLVATQGFSVSSLWGDQALFALVAGETAPDIVKRLVRQDTGADYRQLLVLDACGASSGWTGSANTDFKAHIVDENIAVGGNWLCGEYVLHDLKNSFVLADGCMADRLLHALQKTTANASDTRGIQSAAIKVVSPSRPTLDLRIDFSDSPIDDLTALYRRTCRPEYTEFLSRLPTLDNPQQY